MEVIAGREITRTVKSLAALNGGDPLSITIAVMTLVVPGTLTAVPAVITTRSPGWTRPVARDASSVRAQRSSTSLHSSISAEITPHSSASCCTA